MISILLATYNGEKHLFDQLESLYSQTYNDFSLYVRDDCSTDKTKMIIEQFKTKHADIFFSSARSNSGSAKHSFMHLMRNIQSDYVFLCDQDDIWLPDKIEKTLNRIKDLEQQHGTDKPILVHTDLTVVDQTLRVISPSFRQAMNAGWEKRTKLRHMLAMNIVTGCTAAYNKALAQLLTVEPAFCIMHDWWLLLVASAFGVVDHLDDATILYRQHENNEIGAKDVRTARYQLARLMDSHLIRIAIQETYKQAESFLLIYGDRLSQEQKHLLTRYARIPTRSKCGRILETTKLGTWKHGITRKIAQVMFI